MEKVPDSDFTNNELVLAALGYAQLGWPVFPLHTPRVNGDRPCSCDDPKCANAGKHSRIRQWPEKATTDPDQIRALWRKWPDSNIGIVTGHRSRLLIVDVDGQEGAVSIAGLEHQHGSLPNTRTVKTGGGGLHYYFVLPEDVEIRNSAGELAPGVDIRSSGGCAVAPPSLHKNGKRYVLQESSIDPAPCPDWLLELLKSLETIATWEEMFVRCPIRKIWEASCHQFRTSNHAYYHPLFDLWWRT